MTMIRATAAIMNMTPPYEPAACVASALKRG